jgi:GntR family transcriptional regulator, transcriptional repressor for pyruvate dehydrogenase complex
MARPHVTKVIFTRKREYPNLSDRLGENRSLSVVETSGSGAAGGRVAEAIGAITRHIRDNDLAPGDRLPSETALSRELNVSRNVVREAYRSMAAMRIIEIANGRRATVAEIDHGAMSLMMEHGVLTQQISIQQVYDVRRTIESRIAALAALRRSDEEGEALVATAAEMRAAIEMPDALMEHDLAFHSLLAAACRNPVFALIVGAFQGITRQTWDIGWRSRPTRADAERMVANHEAIAAAVREGNPARAVEAMGAHFDESVKALVAAGMG